MPAAQFGVPLYGASMEGELVYPAGNPKGCSPFPKKFTSKKGLPVVLLVDRGGKICNIAALLKHFFESMKRLTLLGGFS